MKPKIFFIFIILLLSACSPTRHVPKDKYILNNVKIRTDAKSQTEQELRQYLRQQPNSRSFGLVRLRLGIYNFSGRDSSKWINKFLRNMGDAPVIYDSTLTDRSVSELKKYLNNKGYLDAQVTSQTTFRKRKAKVEYNVTNNQPYRVGNFYYNMRNDTVLAIVRADSAKTLIHRNMLFDTDVLNEERLRITTLLKNSGYYNFNKDYLHYRADSTGLDHVINLRMNLRNATKTDTAGRVITTPQRQYYVRNIRYYTTYDPIATTDFSTLDSLTCRCRTFYFNGSIGIRPEALLDNCYIESGQYNEQQVEKTYSALNALSAIKYVNIKMLEIADNSDTLDCIIFTSPARRQQYSFDVEGTHSGGDLGFAGILGYQHKNLFHGSEVFKTSLRYAYEARTDAPKDLLTYKGSNEAGLETSLTFPKFMFPFLTYDFRRKIQASTEFNMQYNYQRRIEYQRTNLSAGVKYVWLRNKNMRHTVELINVNYVYVPYVSKDFWEQYLNVNSILKYSYDDQLIVSTAYSLYFNQKFLRDNLTTRMRFETAGNTLYGISKLFNLPKKEDSYTVIKDIKFAQYVKTDLDFSYNKYIDYRNNVVYHAGLGLGVPYGNADVMPFEKRYFTGGANSMRGWGVRTLGPAVYKSPLSVIDYNQTGDIKLDMNLEYRFKMFWVLEGALFADAGNIWTLKDYVYDIKQNEETGEDESIKGGGFHFKDFYKQIALSYGAGLRFDFKYFLVRVDMGIKAYNPALDGSNKWRFKGLNYGDDFAFHFAVGYPF
ncbi:MAG: BamA/TamA family outer membrane protein [Prevotellaceae bacterium]|nr:BamA/TamA family outer membrane protein [Prevotellaceae bacterium]